MMRKALLILFVPLLLAACATPGVAGAGASTAPVAGYGATPRPTSTPAAAATPTPTPAPTAAPPAVSASVFLAQNMRLGAILVNAQGRTLYYFLPERGGRIVCTAQCAGFWPPLLTATMAPTAGAELPGPLGVIARPGAEQVTYSRWPLYTFAGDRAPDETNGQGVLGFGGRWYVATPGLQP